MIRLRWQLARDGKGGRVPVKTDAGERDDSDPPGSASPPDRAPARLALDAARRRGLRHRDREAEGVPHHTRALGLVADDLGVDLVTHDFRRSMASFLIIAARADEAAVTGVMEHANIETTRRIYAADWREAEERNEVLMGQLAEAGIVSDLQRNKLGVTGQRPEGGSFVAVFGP